MCFGREVLLCVCVSVCVFREEGAVAVSHRPQSALLPQQGWRCQGDAACPASLRTQAEPLSRLVAVRNIKYHPKLKKKNKGGGVKKYNL